MIFRPQLFRTKIGTGLSVFNIGKNKNKITGLEAEFVSSPGSTSLGNTVIQEGKSLGLIYGYETDGVFRSQEEVDYYESLNPDYMYQEKYSYRKTIPVI